MLLRPAERIAFIKQADLDSRKAPCARIPWMSEPENLLMVADSEHDANMLYAVGMFLPEPFIFFRVDGKAHIVVSDAEMARARRKARHCRVISHNQSVERLRRDGVKKPTLATVVQLLLRERNLKKILVPADFPHGLARDLRRHKIKVRVKKTAVFPERALKRADEVRKISGALTMAEVGLAEGIQALKNSKIGQDGKLTYHGAPLTSEKLRGIIDTAILQAGGTASHTIVAGGRQACEPHEQGHGPLRAHEPIIIDVFPRSQKTGYYGDITRTVVRGRASEAVRKLYGTVERAQQLVFSKLLCDMPAADVHKVALNYFEKEGYKTGRKNGRMQGFFHGVGHGLGMEVHESPRVSGMSTDVLEAGHVVTVEPGLYYPEIGGVRLEDVASITPTGARNLTKFEKSLEI
jgi:Xaa-Pro aminopeptidase